MHRWAAAMVLVVGCAGEGTASDGDTEGETETETGSSDDGASTTATTTQTTTVSTTTQGTTVGSASADSTDDGASSEGEAGSTAADESTAGSDGTCPPGGEGCLCDIGSMCDEGLECIDGTCVAVPACKQLDEEPNDDEASAVPLGDAVCMADPEIAVGTLEGEEVDWFGFGLPEGFCFGQASAVVTNADEVDLEVCVYAVCEQGTSNVSCGFGNGLDDATSPDGNAGCCGVNAAHVEQPSCGFMQPPPGAVVVSVGGAAAEACLEYALAWEY